MPSLWKQSICGDHIEPNPYRTTTHKDSKDVKSRGSDSEVLSRVHNGRLRQGAFLHTMCSPTSLVVTL